MERARQRKVTGRRGLAVKVWKRTKLTHGARSNGGFCNGDLLPECRSPGDCDIFLSGIRASLPIVDPYRFWLGSLLLRCLFASISSRSQFDVME